MILKYNDSFLGETWPAPCASSHVFPIISRGSPILADKSSQDVAGLIVYIVFHECFMPKSSKSVSSAVLVVASRLGVIRLGLPPFLPRLWEFLKGIFQRWARCRAQVPAGAGRTGRAAHHASKMFEDVGLLQRSQDSAKERCS